VIKGILTAEDAGRAVDEGADAIVISNALPTAGAVVRRVFRGPREGNADHDGRERRRLGTQAPTSVPGFQAPLVTRNGAIVAGFDVLEETPLTGVWFAVAAVVALVAALR
jgi:hypothetical protein